MMSSAVDLARRQPGAARSSGRLDHHWMPFTSNREFKSDPKIFARAEGVTYTSEAGERILDGSSGLFTTPAGHGRPEIAQAVYEQLLALDYAPSFTRGHPKAFELAKRIAALTPEGLDRVFFVNSGSEAVDTAMKMALAYHRARGEGQRTMFVSRERAYHGVNFGGVALSGMVKNRQTFGPGLPGVVHMRHTWLAENRFKKGEPEHGAELADDLQRITALVGGDNIAACIVEPIAGSTGVLVPPKGYLERLRRICDQHGILLVFDEVITGFGRTGRAFAAQSFRVTPDIMTMAKAITSGYLPLSATVISEEIYRACVGQSEKLGVFAHGYTYTGHPAACAVALEVLDIFEERDLLGHVGRVGPMLQDGVRKIAGHPLVGNVRGVGLMAGMELVPDKPGRGTFDPPGSAGSLFVARAQANGLIVRNLQDTVALCPPLIISEGEIDELLKKFGKALDETSDALAR
jgi:beta-alanine--pyruvate transaminase